MSGAQLAALRTFEQGDPFQAAALQELQVQLRRTLFYSSVIIQPQLELAEDYGKATSEGVQLGIKLSHQDMANMIGIYIIGAHGLNLLTGAARDLGDVITVAPDREQSATSHSLTIHRPLRAREARPGAHVVDGTPTDCVIVALRGVLDSPPDLCLSGVNHGPNMGEDVLYSGTVAAAMEATVLGIPSVALSYAGEDYENLDAWAGVVGDLLARLTPLERFPKETLLNVNLPPVSPNDVRGVRVTNLGQRRYSDSLTRTKDPRGREYFWIGGGVALLVIAFVAIRSRTKLVAADAAPLAALGLASTGELADDGDTSGGMTYDACQSIVNGGDLDDRYMMGTLNDIDWTAATTWSYMGV